MKKGVMNSILFKSKEFTKELEKVYLEIFNENI
jgi:predicted O-linked N-acetylglucosamine transferase (SPINDLY family)